MKPAVRTAMLKRWFSAWAKLPPSGPNQALKGPQNKDQKLQGHSNIWVGQWNGTAWIKYFEFNLNQRFSSLLHLLQSRRQTYFIVFTTAFLVESGYSWVTLFLSWVRNRLASLVTDHTATRHSETCKYLSVPRNMLHIIQVLTIFLLVEVNN